MPNVVLEAMASGKPVVATAAEGVAEVLGPDPGPQIVPLGDSQALSGSLLAVLADPALAARLGAANRGPRGPTFLAANRWSRPTPGSTNRS